MRAERCQVRYDEIVEEANDKLADARQELEDGKKEANEKLRMPDRNWRTAKRS